MARHVAALGAGLNFLQEVEDVVFDALQSALPGHRGSLAKRGGVRAEGCATFWPSSWRSAAEWRLEFAGRDRRMVQVHLFEPPSGERLLGTANTHLSWDAWGAPARSQAGFRQAEELLAFLDAVRPAPAAWIVAGDFNRSPDSEVLALFSSRGFASAHASCPRAATFGAPGPGQQIDFLLHTAGLAAEPTPPAPLRPVMPCEDEPSDHLPLASAFRWRENRG